MITVSVRDLRNNTASVVASVTSGESVTLTSNGRPVARIEPLDPYLKPYLTWEEFLAMPKADPGLWTQIKAMRELETDWEDDPWSAA